MGGPTECSDYLQLAGYLRVDAETPEKLACGFMLPTAHLTERRRFR